MDHSLRCNSQSLLGIPRFPRMDLQFQIEACSVESSGQHGASQSDGGRSFKWFLPRERPGTRQEEKLMHFKAPDISHLIMAGQTPSTHGGVFGPVPMDLHSVLSACDSHPVPRRPDDGCDWMLIGSDLRDVFYCHDYNTKFIYLIFFQSFF